MWVKLEFSLDRLAGFNKMCDVQEEGARAKGVCPVAD